MTAGTTGALLLGPAGAVWAEAPGAWVDVDDDDSVIDFGAQDGQQAAAVDGATASSCTWRPADGAADGVPVLERGQNAQYDWYVKQCTSAGGTVTRTLIAVPAAAPAVDPLTLRAQAVDRLALPAPIVAFNPPAAHVVQVPSWLWIDPALWQTRSRSVSAGGVTVTVTATPQRVLWDMGNGDVVACLGPGTAYDARRPAAEQTTDCSYTYPRSSAGRPRGAFVVTTTIEWQTSWSVTGASGGGAMPPLRTSTSTQVRVAEMQALNR